MNHICLHGSPPQARRPGAAVLSLMAVLLLAACGGGGGAPPPEPPVADDGRARIAAVSRPGELAQYVQDRLREQVAQGGLTPLDSPVPGLGWMPPTFAVAPVVGDAAEAPLRSGTLVQEEGVNEADLLISHGERLYSLQPDGAQGQRLQVHQRSANGTVVVLKSLPLPAPEAASLSTEGMYLSDDGSALAVVSQAWSHAGGGVPCVDRCDVILPGMLLSSSVIVQRVAATAPELAAAGDRLRIDGSLIDSRRIGNRLYLVTSHTPRLAVQDLPPSTAPTVLQAAIAGITATDVLPKLRRNGGPATPLVADTDCFVQTRNASKAVAITTITVLDMGSATLSPRSRCFVGGTEALYMSPTHLYLATTRMAYAGGSMAMMWAYPVDIRTDVHKFALVPEGVAYRASGDVAGHLGWDVVRKPYRFSEHNGDLRVLTFTGPTGWFVESDRASHEPSPATLTVLRENPAEQRLQTVATLPNATRPGAIGKPGEQVYAVRFVGDRGYVVTFRRVDPLYVLDLSNPADPKAVGELEVAGYSDQLFPLPNGLLLGVGRDADEQGVVGGIKLALFDVADPTQPSQRGSVTLGHSASSSALDFSRHGLNLLLKDGVARVSLPMSLAPLDPWVRGAVWRSGLQRFEVDTATRSLRTLPMVGARPDNSWAHTAFERSLQIGDQVYYLNSEGELVAYDW